MTAKDCAAWEHVYQGWGFCLVFPKEKKYSGGRLHTEDPVCDNNCPHFIDAVLVFAECKDVDGSAGEC